MNAKVSEPKSTKSEKTVQIKAPDLRIAHFRIIGTSPYVQFKFSEKTKQKIKTTQEAGSTSRSKKDRVSKDFDAVYREAMHVSTEGWIGIPATAFRSAMISACRLGSMKMTIAKLSVFVKQDGFGSDGTPLVKIEGEPEQHIGHARNANGSVDLRCRPMWKTGWAANVRIIYDADMVTASDVANLLERVGSQVGIGEGRYDSRQCSGIGWGCFSVDRSLGVEGGA